MKKVMCVLASSFLLVNIASAGDWSALSQSKGVILTTNYPNPDSQPFIVAGVPQTNNPSTPEYFQFVANGGVQSSGLFNRPQGFIVSSIKIQGAFTPGKSPTILNGVISADQMPASKCDVPPADLDIKNKTVTVTLQGPFSKNTDGTLDTSKLYCAWSSD